MRVSEEVVLDFKPEISTVSNNILKDTDTTHVFMATNVLPHWRRDSVYKKAHNSLQQNYEYLLSRA